MSIWVLVFVCLWAPVICLASVLLGGYLMYCKQKELNPLRSGFFIGVPEEPPEAPARKKEEPKGFYD